MLTEIKFNRLCNKVKKEIGAFNCMPDKLFIKYKIEKEPIDLESKRHFDVSCVFNESFEDGDIDILYNEFCLPAISALYERFRGFNPGSYVFDKFDKEVEDTIYQMEIKGDNDIVRVSYNIKITQLNHYDDPIKSYCLSFDSIICPKE